ncbi:hypothetical protein HRE53_17745 [Acaryochloris sp. 'Moss Beach']|uniref:hypothetical protein n=1 Tax=Acaryochloris sp. 'Moss Beach' TaxID=2740837 RepID=UPI001F44981B|nr:hypothetical protein [Acaryochloris sp. 'Moss Beach']UJB68378.1 hypothetical protein HRE53_17745 [Acaryochloris sp. 'Moss Beach']
MLLYLADLLQHPLHYPVIPICIAPRLQVEDRMEDDGLGVQNQCPIFNRLATINLAGKGRQYLAFARFRLFDVFQLLAPSSRTSGVPYRSYTMAFMGFI